MDLYFNRQNPNYLLMVNEIQKKKKKKEEIFLPLYFVILYIVPLKRIVNPLHFSYCPYETELPM